MIRVLFFLFLVLTVDVTYSRDGTSVDSMILELDTMSNTPDKVSQLLKISTLLGNSDPVNGMNYASVALALAIEVGDVPGQAAANKRKAQMYIYSGEFDKCIAANLQALKIFEKLGDSSGIATSFADIGEVYNLRNQSNKALQYHRKSLAIRQKLDDQRAIASSLGNIGSTNRKLRKFDEALRYFNRALAIAKKEGYSKLKEAFLNNMGNVYGDKGDYSKSLESFLQFLQIKEEQDDKRGMAICLSNIGGLYNKIENYKLAIKYFERSMLLAEELEFTILQHHIYPNIAVSYQEYGDYKNAFEYLQAYSTLNETMMNEKNNKTIEGLRAKYESEKQEKEIAEKDLMIQQGKEEARRQEQLKYGITTVLIISIIFTLLLYSRFRVIREQKGIIERQKLTVDEKNKDITDSINYAKRIQTSMLRTEHEMFDLLGEHFVLFLPKDVVSGDFYWCHQQGDVVIWVVADCTGHGVPGAFMSMIGNSLMNEIIIEKKLTTPGLILDELKAGIIKSLGVGRQDGMDMALCAFNRTTYELQFAGANNRLYITRKGIGKEALTSADWIATFDSDLIVIKPDKQSVGFEEDKDVPFTTRSIQLEKGDCIYACSDGYLDQFGGKKNKKYSVRRFKEVLSEIHTMSMEEQMVHVTNELFEWMEDKEQIDDICVIGVRVEMTVPYSS